MKGDSFVGQTHPTREGEMTPTPQQSYSYLSSAPFGSSDVGQRKVNMFCACYKSEDNDIGETMIDRLSTEGTGEAILLEGNLNQISPWRQQFPKRWVIVLLCFTAWVIVLICFTAFLV